MTKITWAALTLTTFSVALGCTGSGRTRDPGTTSGRDAGTTANGDAGVDPRDDPTLTEYGRGEYAILLSEANPRRYCWFIEETVRICGGNGSPTRDDYIRNACFDDETNCLAVQPQDSERESGGCWTRITYDRVGTEALYGDCDRVDRYFGQRADTDCLYHRHCPDARLCVDYQCVCPPGADCGCFECPPLQGPRCEGNVRVEQRHGEGCDENDRCWIDEQRTDCSTSGGTCEAGACVGGGGGVDAGVGRDGGAGRDAGHRDGGSATGECTVASDCPPAGPTPIGLCAEVRCESNQCVEEVGPC